MNTLWRGNRLTQLRIASGLVLFVYALTHFLNIGLGLFSADLLHHVQLWRQLVTRSLPGGFLLYGALLAHIGLALYKLAGRRTLRIPPWEAVQIVLGLAIPFLLIAHITHTRIAHEWFGVNDQMDYLIGLIFGTPDAGWQSLLMLIVWLHGCVGLHFWLRSAPWWRRLIPTLAALAALVPAFALAGFLTQGRRAAQALADPVTREAMMARFNWPDAATFATLFQTSRYLVALFGVTLGLVALYFLARKLLVRRTAVRIRYADGPEISAERGPTLLEMSRANGVPHTALCGGRGRCTTCRVVIEEGAEFLHPPSDAELRSLQAVGAAPDTRLACQIRPTDPLTVFRVFRPDGRRKRSHASQGEERRMAILFLDIRGFTARTTGQLPYDVVFLLNRFFDAIVPAITGAGGVVDKYLGDGLLAIFETADEAGSARAALRATADIGAALTVFNQLLKSEGAAGVRIGIGLHLGDLVLGEIGAASHAPRTIIGETVNAASRLEAKTKELGIEALVSEPLLISAGIDISTLELVELDLRGVREAIRALGVKRAVHLNDLLRPRDAAGQHAADAPAAG